MKNSTILRVLISIVLSSTTTGRSHGQRPLDGNWIGEFRLEGETTLFRADFATAKPAINLLPFGPAGLALTGVKQSDSHVHFEVMIESQHLIFDGEPQKAKILGKVASARTAGRFEMIRAAKLGPKQMVGFSGAYRVNARRSIIIAPLGEFAAEQSFVDLETGRCGPIYALSDDSFFSGPAIFARLFPIDVRTSFAKNGNGQVTGLNYERNREAGLRAKKIAFIQEEIKARNGSIDLAGTLTLPAGDGPHPAVILIHGSGPEDRHYLEIWVHYFIEQEMAVLAYDKRGVGASTGDWKRSNFEDLAGDVEAMFSVLKKNRNVDAKRIGLWGVSQGGWIAPIVASRHDDVAFIILHAGPAVTVAQQGLQHLEYELRARGLPMHEIQQALALQKLDDQFTRTGKGWDQLQKEYGKALAAKGRLVEAPEPKDSWFRTFYRGIIDFDPIPFWEKVHCPVLAFYGEMDWIVPPEENQRVLRKALEKAGNKDYRIVVLPMANHLFLQAETGTMAEFPSLKNFVPQYFSLMAEWITKRTKG
jgi:uncharacterized protein